MIMQGTALMAYGSKNDCRTLNGNKSVGAKLVNTKARMVSATTILEGVTENAQMAMPVKAIIKVGDSALWLNITNHISIAANHCNL